MAAAAALVALVAGLTFLRSSSGEKSDRVTPSAPAIDLSAAPDGYRLERVEGGLRTAVPKGWRRVAEKTDGILEARYLVLDGPEVMRSLRVFDLAGSTPRQSIELIRAAGNVEERTGPKPFKAKNASGYSMEYLHRITATVYTVSIRFKAADGRSYGVDAFVRDDEDFTDADVRTIAETAVRYLQGSR
ncbi:hypothetical protein [Streptomyces sp. NPDC017940]|uniref:hypothetical protein n=1 Tax=Streptomyces sp. NPDC017940 TaxID=3365017 RepID=UPI0037A56DEB